MKEGLQPTNQETMKRTDHKEYRANGIYTHPETNRPYISVTQIIDNTIAKPALMPWYAKMSHEFTRGNPDCDFAQVQNHIKEYSRRAMDRGSRVHSLVEAYLQGHPVAPTEEDEGYLAALEAWIEKHKVTVLGTEETVYHQSGYAGTMDILARVNGEDKPRVVDAKSGGIYLDHLFQGAAYRQALVDDGVPVGGIMVVGIAPNGTFKTLGCDENEAESYYAGFQAAKTIYEVRNRNKLMKVGYFGEEGNE